jgi:hypothetical protein
MFVQSFVIADVDKSLVLYLPFDEGSGDLAEDVSFYQNNGTLKGPKWVNGKFYSALKFNGTSDFVEVPFSDSLNIDPASSLTIEAWVSVPNPDANWRAIVVKGDDAWDWGIYKSTSNTFMTGLNNLHEVYSSTNVEKDKWYHVAGVYDNTNWYIYVNGKLETKKENGAKIGKSNNGLSIGKKGVAIRDFFDGTIDEVRVWNRALSEKEISANMNRGRKQFFAIHQMSKLPITWSLIKTKY